MASIALIVEICIICASLFIPICCTATAYQSHQQSKKHAVLFVFGDSLFDAGNNNYINCGIANQANFWPYGETFFRYPTGRFCDGRLVPDFIAEYAGLPLIPPFLQPGLQQYTNGVNFASGGAGVLNETRQGVINLKMQLDYFLKVNKALRQKLGDTEAKKMMMRAVYLFSIGGNDYHNISSDLPQSYKREYVGMVIGNLTSVLKEIYNKGGRKFGFQNAGPLGCIPGTLKRENSSECVQNNSAMAKLHNIALSKVLQKLESELHGFKYSIFDYYTSLSQRVNYPSKYGFKEGKIACCGSGPYRGVNSCGGKRGVKKYHLCRNPNEHVWFDFAHTTERANQQLAQLMWRGVPNVTGPYYNVKALFEM
ncbi:GDSL esterase/lipase 1-like [Cornus florida]|uniref:GDSL esterase/lipase 1-like n=1 Tax=Cornus florida TaxID=4283 RepID=UPI0028A0816A|nr:GDSL esterase/lipase 1-like [Cornus florida]